MRHVVLGAGGIGGLLAAVLARTGAEVTVVVRRPDGRAREIAVRSTVFGDFTADVGTVATVPPDTDVLWVAVKATGLTPALDLADPAQVGGASVVPLLNGIDHVAVLRERYRVVCPATIRVESHRSAPGLIEQRSPFAHIAVATGRRSGVDPAIEDRVTRALEALRVGGFATSTSRDEVTLLWDKLAFLGPIALATTARDRPLGAVRDDPVFRRCQQEAVAAAHHDGAATDLDAIRALVNAAPTELRSSMQLDVAAGREPELDAIAGAVLRRSTRDGAPATRALAAQVQARLG